MRKVVLLTTGTAVVAVIIVASALAIDDCQRSDAIKRSYLESVGEAVAVAPDWVPEVCKRYVAGMERCIDAAPQGSRKPLINFLNSDIETWKMVGLAPTSEDVKTVGQRCALTIRAARDSLTACPADAWE